MEKPAEIGGYQIEEELAKSSTATVYRAFEPALGRRVLIKKLHPQVAREPEVRARFEREAQLCARLEHTNIVRVFGYRSEPNLTMMVMEFVAGESLRSLLDRLGSIEWRTLLVILYQVLKGLASAHARGVLHRDIKPDNILISQEGEAKLTDFGLAVLEDAPHLTRQGAVVGTPAYMPPEQISGEPADRRSDLFSVGATFYEALTGVSPFKAETFSETMNLILTAELQPPSATVPEIPPEVDRFILKLLDKRPARRFGSAEEALEELRRIAGQHNAPLAPESVAQLIAESAGSTPTRTKTPSSVIVRRKSRRVELAAGLILVAAVAVLLLRQVMKPPQEQPAQTPKTQTEPSDTAAQVTIRALPEPSGSVSDTFVQPERSPAPPPQAGIVSQPVASEPIPLLAASGVIPDSTAPVTGTGWLKVTCDPWANITINQTAYGSTPISDPIELPAGEHQIIFTNDNFPAPVMQTVVIHPGESHEIHMELWDYVGVLKVRAVNPWAEIYVDGELVGQTPLANPIILAFGEHIIELRNPGFPIQRRMLNFSPEHRSEELTADLTDSGGAEGQNR